MPKRILVLIMDSDGCLLNEKFGLGEHGAYYLAQRNAFERLGEPPRDFACCDVQLDSMTLSIANQYILRHLRELAEEKEVIELSSGSSRQDVKTDLGCGYPLAGQMRCSGSSTQALKIVARDIRKSVPSNVIVRINTSLRADSDNELEPGSTFKQIDDLINRQFDSPERKNEAFKKAYEESPRVKNLDPDKTELIPQMVATAAASYPNDEILVCFYENEPNILDKTHHACVSKLATIASNVTVQFYLYSGNGKPELFKSIQGQGTGAILETPPKVSYMEVTLPESTQIARISELIGRITGSPEWRRAGIGHCCGCITKAPLGVGCIHRIFTLQGKPSCYEELLELLSYTRKHISPRGWTSFFRSSRADHFYQALLAPPPFSADDGSISAAEFLNHIEEHLLLYVGSYFPGILEAMGRDNSPAEPDSANESTPLLRGVRS